MCTLRWAKMVKWVAFLIELYIVEQPEAWESECAWQSAC